MNILLLQGSPRANGNTAWMAEEFRKAAEAAGHKVTLVNVAHKKIAGCLACEYCHGKGNGACVQKDDMQEVHAILRETDMLVIASPIYYHGLSGQLKCAIDRLYAVAYPSKPERLRKVAIFLSSGDADMYEGALFSYRGDFLDYLGLEDMGVFTVHGGKVDERLEELRDFGRRLS